jgi:hypothetical protein
MRDKTEAKIQQEIFIHIKNNFGLEHHNPKWIILSIPNESASKEETMRKLSIGMLPGASDMVLIQPNKITFIEVKTPTGEQSDNQITFENDVKRLGFDYILVRSLDDVKKYLSI